MKRRKQLDNLADVANNSYTDGDRVKIQVP